MSSLSAFLALGGSGAVKTAYYTNSGSKVLVPHDGVDKLVYIFNTNGGWIGTPNSDRQWLLDKTEQDLVKAESDYSLVVDNGYDETPETIIDAFSVPGTGVSAAAITFLGNNLATTDNANIYITDGLSSTVIETIPVSALAGLAFDGVNLISGANTSTVRVHEGISSTISYTLSISGNDITYDGRNLIRLNRTDGMINVYDGLSETLLRSFPTAFDEATYGLGFDGRNLVSMSGGKITIHNGVSENILETYTAPATLYSFAFNGARLISISDNDDTIRVHGSHIPKKITLLYHTSRRRFNMFHYGKLNDNNTIQEIVQSETRINDGVHVFLSAEDNFAGVSYIGRKWARPSVPWKSITPAKPA